MRKYYYLISFILFALILNGCSSSYFYQVYETRLPDNVNMKDGKLYYEDQNCQISYNLWGDKGVIGFSFYNKSDKNIYINLEECFFVKNGVAYDYYKNKISELPIIKSSSKDNEKKINYFTTNHSQSINAYKANTSSEYQVEKKVICIPAKTLKYFNEYSIVDELYRSCNLLRFPNNNTTDKYKKKENFTEEKSPLKFGNIITYSLDNNLSKSIRVNNTFSVKSIANYRSNLILKEEPIKFCNEVSPIPNSVYVFNDSIYSAHKFYFQYSKTLRDQFTH